MYDPFFQGKGLEQSFLKSFKSTNIGRSICKSFQNLGKITIKKSEKYHVYTLKLLGTGSTHMYHDSESIGDCLSHVSYDTVMTRLLVEIIDRLLTM